MSKRIHSKIDKLHEVADKLIDDTIRIAPENKKMHKHLAKLAVSLHDLKAIAKES